MFIDRLIGSLRPRVVALHEEDGTSTVEFVIWTPLIMFVFALIADTALIFGGEARVLRVVQDANRAMSIGRITEVKDAQDLVLSQIQNLAPHAIVTTTVVSGLINTVVAIPATDFTSVGLVDAFLNLTVTVSAQHLAES